jgi:hypothetical protein
VVAVVPVRIEDFTVLNLLFVAVLAEIETFLHRLFVALPAYPVLSARIVARSPCRLILMLLRPAFTTHYVDIV